MYFSAIYITLILLAVHPLWIYNQNTVDENADLQTSPHAKISRKPKVVGHDTTHG